MNDGGTHIVVAPRGAVTVVVFLEDGRVNIGADLDLRGKGMRLRNHCLRLQKIPARDQRKFLLRTIRAQRGDARRIGGRRRPKRRSASESAAAPPLRILRG